MEYRGSTLCHLSANKVKGFTLIELLVVIAIIGMLSSVVLASLNSARAKSRDARRKADLKQVQLALDLYYDKYGTYRVSGGGWLGGGTGWVGYEGAGTQYPTAVTRVLSNEGFLGSPLVDDPRTKPGYMLYLCAGDRYSLTAQLENPSAADIAYIQTTCNGVGSNGTYTVYGRNYALGN